MASVIVVTPLAVSAQESAPFDGGSLAGNVDQGKVGPFAFEDADWEDVIKWFVEQTGYSWQKRDKFPAGTFTLDNGEKYTPMEALDQLNYALRLQNPPYTIVRHRDQLILTEASKPLPAELIPKVTAEQLDERGDYEILTCQFDLGVLDVLDVEKDLMSAVDGKYNQFTKTLATSNAFLTRGTGADLKNIRDMIRTMTHLKQTTYTTYTLKHYDPEQFLMVARGPLGIQGEQYAREDGSLNISVDQASGRLLVLGNPAAHHAFKELVEHLDVPPNEGESGMESSTIKSYPITADPEMVRKVIETQLDGTTATIGQDTISGAIVLRGTEAQHKIAAEVIQTIQGESGSTKIVELQNASATSILEAVSSLLNLSTTSADAANAPRMLANTSQNYIMIHGSPQQVFKITGMINQLDQAQGRDPNRIRTNARVIEMSEEKRDKLLNSVQDYWPSTGRRNTIRIIMPDEKVQDKMDSERGRGMSVPKDSSTGVRFPPRRRSPRRNKLTSRSTVRQVAYQEAEAPANATVASSESETAESETVGSNYVPPVEVQSVPGAALSIKATPFGVLIESDDLDALDDLEDIFRQQAVNDTVDQGLTVFYLKFRKATFVKAELEDMFGLESDSGGSGGGGDLMSGIVDNMAGGGAGDLLGGLLGGSSSSSSKGKIELTGDVQFGMSVPLNLLYVSGATSSDLNYIEDAIELFDQPSPPQNPELVGQTYSIPILHRSPQGVFDKVRELMGEYIYGGAPTAQGGGGGGEDEGAAKQMAKMMRGMAGGGGGDQGGAATEEAPKARMSLDQETSQILVVGPEFIYQQVLALVESIDTPDLSKPKPYEHLPAEFFSPGALEILRNAFGSKLSVSQGGEDSETEADPQSNNGRDGQGDQAEKKNTKAAQASREQAAQAEFFRNLRNRAGAGGGGQRGGGGGARGGGGGGQRGGGGGQRGGGGGGRR